MNIPKIGDDVRATHENLSTVSLQFIEHACANLASHPSREEQLRVLPDWLRERLFAFQQWPAFVGVEKMREVRRAAEEVMGLIKSIPERIFDLNPERIGAFYGFPNPQLAAIILAPPNGIQEAVGRCDFIDSEGGFKCLEANMGAYLGGWQSPFWAKLLHHDPVVTGFLAERRLSPTFHDTLRSLFTHFVTQARQRDPALREVNLALVVPAEAHLPAYQPEYFNEVYAQILAKLGEGLSGRVIFCLPTDLAARQAKLYHQDQRIHAVVEYTSEMTPETVYRCFKAGSIHLYNGPLRPILGDKRNLALLSTHEDSDRFTAAERASIQAYIPWTREVASGQVSCHGETVVLPDFLLARREDLVLKAADAAKGDGVIVGRHMPPDVWAEKVRTALEHRGWVVQERVEGRPHLYLDRRGEPRIHDVVWGLFCLGASYGGGFLRALPREGSDGVINSARGASEGFIFELPAPISFRNTRVPQIRRGG